MQKKDNHGKFYVAGSIAGLVEVASTHPIDVIKTRIQQQYSSGNKFKFSHIGNMTVKQMYSGLQSRLIGIAPMRAVFWGTQDISNNLLKDYITQKDKRIFLSGLIGGCAQTLIDAPIEFVKTQKIKKTGIGAVNGLHHYKFVGFNATLYRNSMFASIFHTIANNDDIPICNKMVKFGLAGFTACILTQPFDYYKTQVQTFDNLSPKEIRSNIYQSAKKNIFVLWTGMIPRAVLGFCTMSIGGYVYKMIMNGDDCKIKE